MDDLNQYPIIALNDALARVGGRKPLLAKLLNAYAASPRKDELTTALSNRNIEAVITEAHAIKGVALNLSLVRLEKCVEEKQAKKEGGAELESVFDQIDASLVIQVIDETVEEISVTSEALKN
jgi:HPt (histidine-containing phosphotransfer) domain-containing protein